MHVEFLVEEPSAEAALIELLPKLLGTDVGFQVHAHQGKEDLLGSLPAKLRAYRKWIPEDWRIVVLIDRDSENCIELKRKLERIAKCAKLFTGSSARGGHPCLVLNRIAIEELEAWFFGDIRAVCAAYPRVPETLGARAAFRDPDGIRGGTWERLEQVLQKAGHFKGGLGKIEAARAIAKRMDPDANRSRSFRVFRDGLRGMVGLAPSRARDT